MTLATRKKRSLRFGALLGAAALMTSLAACSGAGSDAPLEGEEIDAATARCSGPAWDLPVYISPVAVIFNLDGVKSLNLTAPTIAKIFSNRITNWTTRRSRPPTPR